MSTQHPAPPIDIEASELKIVMPKIVKVLQMPNKGNDYTSVFITQMPNSTPILAFVKHEKDMPAQMQFGDVQEDFIEGTYSCNEEFIPTEWDDLTLGEVREIVQEDIIFFDFFDYDDLSDRQKAYWKGTRFGLKRKGKNTHRSHFKLTYVLATDYKQEPTRHSTFGGRHPLFNVFLWRKHIHN